MEFLAMIGAATIVVGAVGIALYFAGILQIGVRVEERK